MKYKRILLKISGESLGGKSGAGLDSASLNAYAEDIKAICDYGAQVAIVVGGGNIFRGLSGVGKGVDRVTGDKMGMLATTINSLALMTALHSVGVKAEVFSATPMESFATYYNRDNALKRLQEGVVTIICGGTGNPFFTTDTASALRAIELGADVFLKGTRVDGIYTADPEKDPTATKFSTITFDEALQRNLKVMDSTAFTLCKENGMKVVVFDMNGRGNALRVVKGEEIGTVVTL